MSWTQTAGFLLTHLWVICLGAEGRSIRQSVDDCFSLANGATAAWFIPVTLILHTPVDQLTDQLAVRADVMDAGPSPTAAAKTNRPISMLGFFWWLH